MTARRSRPDASTPASSRSLPGSTKSEQSHNPPRVGRVARGASRRRSAQLDRALHGLQSVRTAGNQRIRGFRTGEPPGHGVDPELPCAILSERSEQSDAERAIRRGASNQTRSEQSDAGRAIRRGASNQTLRQACAPRHLRASRGAGTTYLARWCSSSSSCSIAWCSPSPSIAIACMW
jgi:hypothetical protein